MTISYRDIHHEPNLTIQKHNVFGEWSDDFSKILNKGMIVAKHLGEDTHEENKKHYKGVCPIWDDILLYKSCTIICEADQEAEVEHWVRYVMGGPPTRRKELDDGRIAFRADYQAW